MHKNEELIKLDFFRKKFAPALRYSPNDSREISIADSIDPSISKLDAFFNKGEDGVYVDLYDFVDEEAVNSEYDGSRKIEENDPHEDFHEQSFIHPKTKGEKTFLQKLAEKNEFESNLESTVNPFFSIKGYAGTGKTTYLRYLKHKYKDIDDLSFHIIDLTNTSKDIFFLNYVVNFENVDDPKSPLWVVVMRLVVYITALLRNNKYSPIDELNNAYVDLAQLKNTVKSLQKEFNVLKQLTDINDDRIAIPKIAKAFFDELYNCVNTSIDDELGGKLEDFFDTYILNVTPSKALKVVVDVVLLLVILFSRMNNKRYIIAIDNIEFLLKFDDRDVVFTVKDVREIIDSLVEAYEGFKDIKDNLNPSNLFSFVLVTRSSTYDFTNAHKCAHYCNGIGLVDATKAVDIKNIVTRRIQKVVCPDECKTNEYIQLFKMIIEDKTTHYWNLHDILCEINNYDYRQITSQLVRAVETMGLDNVKFFIRHWNYLGSKENNLGTKNTNFLKHLLRKNFTSFLLRQYNESDHLSSLIPVTTGNIKLKPYQRKVEDPNLYPNNYGRAPQVAYTHYSFFTRKLLNIARNHAVISTSESDNGISLSELFVYIFENHHELKLCRINENADASKVSEGYFHELDFFCNLVLKLTDASFEALPSPSNEGFPRCVDLSFEDKTFELNVLNLKDYLIKELAERHNGVDTKNKSSLSLTPSGRFFRRYLFDFEMYSVRFLYGNTSLFSHSSHRLPNKCETIFIFEKIIHYIKDRALEKIKIAMLDDYFNFQYSNDDVSDGYGITTSDSVGYSYFQQLRKNDEIQHINSAIKMLHLHMGYINGFINILKGYKHCEIYAQCKKCSECTECTDNKMGAVIINAKIALQEYYEFFEFILSDKCNVFVYNFETSLDMKMQNRLRRRMLTYLREVNGKTVAFFLSESPPEIPDDLMSLIPFKEATQYNEKFDNDNFFPGYKLHRTNWNNIEA